MDWSRLTVKVLKDICREHSIKGYSNKKKDDIIELLNLHLPSIVSPNQELNVKGSGCSLSGKKYELHIHNTLKNYKLNGKLFNTQTEGELGGCGSKNDIQCANDVNIEVKKSKAPDWMQCSLKYVNGKWVGSPKNKIPDKAKELFELLISTNELFGGTVPPFMLRDITHEEWLCIKKQTDSFNDTFYPCPSDTIQKLYREKGCSYIQISEKGLYHLGDDICQFKVPEFICEQQLRIRTKIHVRRNAKGFCKLSVIVACQPKDIRSLPSSTYSLDDASKLPEALTL